MLPHGAEPRVQAADLTPSEPEAIRRPARRPRRFDLSGLSLARRYLLLSLVFVVIGGGVVAVALGQLIETSAINRTTSVTALYVESFVAPELQTLADQPGSHARRARRAPTSPDRDAPRQGGRVVPHLVDGRPHPVQPVRRS